MPVSELIDVTIERLAAGGDALARHEGMVVFVPLAAAGDRVRVRIVERKKGYARGEIVEILAPGPARRTPPCEHFGVCGGCSWQHIEYQEQLRWKKELVREALLRIGGIEWVHDLQIESAQEWGWRTRVQWKVAKGKGSLIPALGYHVRKSHSVVDVQRCPVLAPALEDALGRVRDELRHRATLPAEVHAGLSSTGAVAFDSEIVTRSVGKFAFTTSASSFFQGNLFLLEKLLAAALPEAPPENALELYAGAGLFTLALAERARQVIAIESEPQALAAMKVNLERHGLTERVEVRAESVASALRTIVSEVIGAQRPAPDFVLLDPPRTGAADALPLLQQLAAPALTYVSCDPATLARDLKELLRSGYRLRALRAFDLFPQTHHVEVVARLEAV